jgi:hypothetical protein
MGVLDLLEPDFPGAGVSAGKWGRYAFCPCGMASEPDFDDEFFIPYEVCPRCGRSKYSAVMATARRVWIKDTSVKRVWWKPSTWNPGHDGWIFQDKIPFDEWDEPEFKEHRQWISVEE